MHRIERLRQSVSAPISSHEIEKFRDQGWRLVAVEWERDIPGDEEAEQTRSYEDPPFGLRVAKDSSTLIEDSKETEILVAMMELIVQEGPYSLIAEELNRRGYRTRERQDWTPVSVFEMLPRLIDIGPKIFSSDQWHLRRKEKGQVRSSV